MRNPDVTVVRNLPEMTRETLRGLRLEREHVLFWVGL